MKAISGIMLTLLLICMLILAFHVQPFAAGGNVFIRGEVGDLSATSISTLNNIAYESDVDIVVRGAGPARMRVPDPYFEMIMPVVALVWNNGTKTETFEVSIFYDTTLIGMSTVTLDAGEWQSDRSTVSFSWDLEVLPNGAYTISANASVLLGETDTLDNYFLDGDVRRTFDGDVTADGIVDASDLFDLGKAYGSTTLSADINSDGIVDFTDYSLFAIAYLTTPEDPNWNPYADLDNDGDVDWEDFSDFALYFGEKVGSLGWNPHADIDANNEIGASDLSELSKNYGKTV